MEKILPALIAALLATTSTIATAQTAGSGLTPPSVMQPAPTVGTTVDEDDDDDMAIQYENDESDDEDDQDDDDDMEVEEG